MLLLSPLLASVLMQLYIFVAVCSLLQNITIAVNISLQTAVLVRVEVRVIWFSSCALLISCLGYLHLTHIRTFLADPS